MSAARRLSVPRDAYSWGDAGPVPGQKSRPKASVQDLGSDGFRDFFMTAFARWLQLNFRTPEQVAATFDVRHQTALNWWNARNCASGDTVGVVFLHFPAAVAWFLAEWEASR